MTLLLFKEFFGSLFGSNKSQTTELENLDKIQNITIGNNTISLKIGNIIDQSVRNKL